MVPANGRAALSFGVCGGGNQTQQWLSRHRRYKHVIKIAILGAGGMGQRHAQNILKVGNAEVVAVCSRSLASASKLNQDILAGKAQCFDDFDTMLQQARFDALYVCLPPFAHTGQIQKAAAAKSTSSSKNRWDSTARTPWEWPPWRKRIASWPRWASTCVSAAQP